MNKNKLLIKLLLFVGIFFIEPNNTFAACPQRQLSKVCNICKQQGLDSCSTSSTCKTISLNSAYSVQFTDQYGASRKYIIRVRNFIDENNFTYDIYNPNVSSGSLLLSNVGGFVIENVVYFILPFNLSCIGIQNTNLSIVGGCDELETTASPFMIKYSSFAFTATPTN